MIALTGDSSITELYPSRKWTRQGGYRTVRRWRGLIDDLEKAAASWRATALDYDIDPDDHPYGTLSVTLGTPEDGSPPDESQVTDIWTLKPNSLEKSLWDLPKVTAITRAMSDAGLAQFRKDIEDALEAKTSPEVVPFASNAVLKEFYREMLRGVDSFSFSQYVLQRTRVVEASTSLKAGYDNVGKMYSTEAAEGYVSITTAESIPSSILFVLPPGFWLKQAPEVEQQSNGKFQQVQQWWHAQSYSSFIYDPAVAV